MKPIPAIWHYPGTVGVPPADYAVAIVTVLPAMGPQPGLFQAVAVDSTGTLRAVPLAELTVVGEGFETAITEAQGRINARRS